MGYNRAVKTDAGNELLSRVIAGETTITFTKIATSEKGIDEFEIKQEMSASATKFTRDTKVGVILDTIFSNVTLVEGYYINTIGIYAKDSNNNEIMFSYLTADDTPTYLEAYNGEVPQSVRIQVEAGIWLDDGSMIVIDDSTYATQDFVKDYINSTRELNISTDLWITATDPNGDTYYYKIFNLTGLKPTDSPLISVKPTDPTVMSFDKLHQKYFANFMWYECGNNSITIATSKVPENEFIIELKGIGG